jgi:hypothetical protein
VQARTQVAIRGRAVATGWCRERSFYEHAFCGRPPGGGYVCRRVRPHNTRLRAPEAPLLRRPVAQPARDLGGQRTALLP